MYASPQAQTLLNYFDPSDTRARCRAGALVGQLFNSVGAGFDRLSRTVGLELQGYGLLAATNLDNQGIWYQAAIPNSYNVPLDATGKPALGVLAGQDSAGWHAVIPFDPLNPVPARLASDPSRSPVYLGAGAANLTMAVVDGIGGVQSQSVGLWLSQPNCLTLVVSGMDAASPGAEVRIEGLPEVYHPLAGMRTDAVETLTIPGNGVYRTATSWSYVGAVRCSNLDSGANVVLKQFGFNVDYRQDPSEVVVTSDERGIRWPIYWAITAGRPAAYILKNQASGYELAWQYAPGISFLPAPSLSSSADALSHTVVDDGSVVTLGGSYTYSPAFTASDFAPVPNTAGMLLASGSAVYWMDRRRPCPAQQAAGCQVEPAYSLHCRPDITWSGSTPAIALSGSPAARSADVQRWRYLATDPNGVSWVALPEGGLAITGPGIGWRSGVVRSARVLLGVPGDWTLQLEMLESGSIQQSSDSVAWANAPVRAAAILDASSITASVEGLDFDARNRLWLLSGEFALPASLQYDAYMYTPDTGRVHTTCPYTQLVLP